MKKKITALLITLVTVSLLVLSSPISAKSGNDSPKRGNGLQDPKREHYEPPEQSEKGSRSGWGYGDRNHYHCGYGYKYRGGK